MDDKTSVPVLRLKEAPPAQLREKLAWEKELLGLYISGHPLEEHRAKFEKHELTIKRVKEFADGTDVVIAGLIEEVKPVTTKRGEAMAFVKIRDFTDSIEVVVFPRVLADYKATLLPEQCVALRGRTSARNGTPSVIAEKVKVL